MIGRVHSASRQRGVTLFGLLFRAVIVGFLALIGMRVLPALNEYFTIKKSINKIAAEGVLFTDYYAEASCTAGRANFISGVAPSGN